MLDPNTLIGDYLHHAGDLVLVRIAADGAVTRTRITFRGYADLIASAAAHGLVIQEGADGALTVEASDPGSASDLWAPGTTLLGAPSLDISAPARLPSTRSHDFLSGRLQTDALGMPWVVPVVRDESLQEVTWRQLGTLDLVNHTVGLLDAPIALSVTRYLLRPVYYADGEFGGTIKLQTDRLSDVLTLDHFGDRLHPGQDTALGRYVDREFVLTSHGLVLRFALELPVIHPFHDLLGAGLTNSILDATRTHEWEVDQAEFVLRRRRVIVFDGYGWPALGSDGAFMSPRRERLYAAMRYVGADGLGNRIWVHPKLDHETLGPDGADWSINDQVQEKDRPGVRVLTPLSLAVPADNPTTWPGLMRVYRNTDVLWEFATHNQADDQTFGSWYREHRTRLLANQVEEGVDRMVWQTLLREHYNALATLVNSIAGCRPFQWLNFQTPFEGGTMRLRTNAAGLFGGNVRPAGHYATLTRDSAEHRFCLALRIPIRTVADFPPSYTEFLEASDEDWVVKCRADLSWKLVATGRGPGLSPHGTEVKWADYDCQASFGPVQFSRRVTPPDPWLKENAAAGIFTPHNPKPMPEFLWVSVEDVQAAAEREGFKFLFERIAIPYVLRSFRRSGWAQLTVLGDTVQRETRRISVEGVYLSPVIPDGARSEVIEPASSGLMLALTVPAREWLLTEALPSGAPEWISDGRWEPSLSGFVPWAGYELDPDYTPGDVDTLYVRFAHHWGIFVEDVVSAFYPFTFGVAFIFRSDIDARWRRQQDGILRRRREDLTLPGFFFGAAAAWQAWSSAGIPGQSWAALAPVEEVGHPTSAWSETGAREALGRIIHGAAVLPLTLLDPPEPES